MNARPVYLVLTKGCTSVPIRLATDPRTWAAGETTTVQQTVTLPAAATTPVAAGSASVPAR